MGYNKEDPIYYHPVKRKGDTFKIISGATEVGAIDDYACSWRMLGNGYPLSSVLKKVNTKETNVYFSFFEHDGETYYDIVLLSLKPQKIKYGTILKLAGRTKNKPKHSFSVTHYQIRKKAYALVLIQDAIIGTLDKQVEHLSNIKTRKDYTDWLRQAKSLLTGTFEFSPINQGKYIITQWSISDNLLNFNNTVVALITVHGSINTYFKMREAQRIPWNPSTFGTY